MGDDTSLGERLLCGGCAGALAKTTTAPLDRVKILFQVSSTKTFSLRNAYRTLHAIHQTEGVKALWRGNGAMMLRVVPYAAVQFTAFDAAQAQLQRHFDLPDRSPKLSRFVAGASAGALSVVCTYPLDVLRARMATQHFDTHTHHTAHGHAHAHGQGVFEHADRRHQHPRFSGILHAASSIWRKEGAAALWKGMWPTLLGVVPLAGTSFFVFHTLKHRYYDGEQYVPTHARLVFGGFAGLCAQTVTYPLDSVRRRFQVHADPASHGVFRSLVHIARTEGVRSLFKGVSLNWIKGPLAVGVSFAVNDTLRELVQQRRLHLGLRSDSY
ncbi:MAG: hypothetical protein MHM6MM_003030 [Cercozoa sp. M6MM]